MNLCLPPSPHCSQMGDEETFFTNLVGRLGRSCVERTKICACQVTKASTVKIASGGGDQVQEGWEQDCSHQRMPKETLTFCSCPQVLRISRPRMGLPALQVYDFLSISQHCGVSFLPSSNPLGISVPPSMCQALFWGPDSGNDAKPRVVL